MVLELHCIVKSLRRVKYHAKRDEMDFVFCDDIGVGKSGQDAVENGMRSYFVILLPLESLARALLLRYSNSLARSQD